MQATAQTTTVIESVTVTLSKNEASSLITTLDLLGFSHTATSQGLLGAIRDALGLVTPYDFVLSGAVDSLLNAGQKIPAIKEIRQATGASLKTAKDAADERQGYLAAQERKADEAVEALRKKLTGEDEPEDYALCDVCGERH